MRDSRQHCPEGGLVVLSGLAMLLAVLPLSQPLGWWMPNWFLGIVLFYGFYRPSNMGLWGGWVLGLLADMLGDGLLGVQAGLFVVWMSLLVSQQSRFALYPAWQRWVIAVFMILVTRLAVIAGHWSLGHLQARPDILIPMLISAGLWGIVTLLENRW